MRSSAVSTRERDGETTRIQDVLIGAAAAEVAAHRAPNLVVRRGRTLVEQSPHAHDLAGGAEAALVAIGLDEGALDRVERVAIAQPLDRADLAAVAVDRENQAGVHRL